MASQERTASSRANGAKSHGPVTPEGKQRSSRNSTTHGILSKIPSARCRRNRRLTQAHRERFQPADLVEHRLIEEMCAAKWRLYRLWIAETDSLQLQIDLETGHAKLASAFNAVAASAALMHRYEAHLQRTCQRALRTLIMLRTVARPDPSRSPFEFDSLVPPQVDPPNPAPAPITPPSQPNPLIPMP